MPDFIKTYQVKRVISHTENIKSLRFDKVLTVDPGQFVLLWLPGVDEKPFAVSGIFEDEIEITIKAVGNFTRKIMSVKPGDWLGLRGPFGNGFSLSAGQLLVGGGIGNAPLRFLAQKLKKHNLDFNWVIGVKTASDLAFAGDLCAMPECQIMSEDGSVGAKGIATELVEKLYLQGSVKAISGSGPEPMLLALLAFAQNKNINIELSFERYMKCAIGLCGQCCLDGNGLRVCVEGPVLNSAQLKGVTELGKPHRKASGKR